MVVLEDPLSQEKRFIEMRKNEKMEKAVKLISDISFEVDRLAGQVSAFESVISKGGKLAEKTLLNVIELLMNQLLKLDGIMVDGDVKLQRKIQVNRIQQYVEIMDALKLQNSTPSSNVDTNQTHRGTQPQSKRTVVAHKRQPSSNDVASSEWEIFDSLAAPPSSTTTTNTTHPMFNWDLI
ncbi:BAG family molecular chaperone regulator 1-like protein [Tanacetum coccineum]